MPFMVDSLVGARLGEVDGVNETNKSSKYAIGSSGAADDGHIYIYARASAPIAASTVCILTEPAMTMAAGAGAWTSVNQALATGDRAWFKRTAI